MTDDKRTTADDDEYAPFETKGVPGYTPAPVVPVATNTVDNPPAQDAPAATAESTEGETTEQTKKTTDNTARRSTGGKTGS